MSIYTDAGYLDFDELDNRACTFNIVIGARGIGKTYSSLLHELKNNRNTIYIRRTDTEAKIASKEEFTPFKDICIAEGWGYKISRGKPSIITVNSNGGTTRHAVLAISNIANTRGFSAMDYTTIIYDEFIPERHLRPIRCEAEATWNAYETINRNRELSGKPPVKIWFLANSNNPYNPILADLEVINIVLNMQEAKQERAVFTERSLQIVCPVHSPISEAKSQTALYNLVHSDFKEMALNNSFRYDDSIIKSQNLKEYTPYITVGEVSVYRHRSTGGYYLTFHKSGGATHFGTSEGELTRLRRLHGHLLESYSIGRCLIESAEVDSVFHYITHINR